ncbi:STAS/SEC14 domain-containing protein [Arcobacter sp. CECT 8985]|uniref:STAS/SEC14 domain-containing protein n=1 Tax=Arcobacter sp. CECT 8985 TaxID=1935424 RepID=UPI00100A3BB6|nr:STAS/SEC14 domain-containing protein [Arcobacter sp. CECT 8985]RXJ87039.1 STAS/SEC14 domain-containing protein [Arcobacter sp. CECT 8985]
MSIYKHGIDIGLQKINNDFFLTMKVKGKLTHEDYETIIPLIDNALEGIKQPRIKALIDCSEFEGWEIQAAWDDFKLAFKHGNEFEKVAIINNKKWLEVSSKIVSWFIQGEIENFDNEQEAFNWLEV